MQMVDALATIRPGVDHRPISRLGDSLLAGEGGRESHHAAKQIRIADIIQRGNVFFRHDQNMGRRLWANVAKRDDLLVVHHGLCGDLTARDLAEDAISSVSHWIVWRAPAMPPRSRPQRRRRSQNVACWAS